MNFNYRVSCIISVPKQELLNHAFHYEKENVSINATYNKPSNSLSLVSGQTLDQIFSPMIAAYQQEYGLASSDIVIENYTVSSSDPDITVSFYAAGVEEKFETINHTMTIIAYYFKNSNLGYGLELNEYVSQLPNNTYSLRIGNEVPEGDVNLAYVHTPALNSDENISFIDTSFVDDNVIPLEQLESIMIPDTNGVLSYAVMTSSDQPVMKTAPYDRIPSKDINLTRRFANNNLSITDALYYRFEIQYHYDSVAGIPGEVSLYTGSQIQITDENGNLIDDTQNKYVIYTRCMENNPKIYWVKIYLKANTDQVNTFKVRYNHVDSVVADTDLYSVQKTVELYANDPNANMVEGGKIRVINGISAYDSVTKDVIDASTGTEETFFIEDQPDLDGYRITVPQKAEADPRAKTVFSYRVSATYKDDNGDTVKLTTGFISDWVLDKNALLNHERIDYTNELKSIGMRAGAGFLNGINLIQQFMPLDMGAVPVTAVYTIEDAEGNILYSTEDAPDNADVTTTIQSDGQAVPQAVAVRPSPIWDKMNQANIQFVNNPISHVVTIFPEQQKDVIDFTWEASGKGTTSTTLQYDNYYKIGQDLIVMKENTKKLYDVFYGWNYIGASGSKSDWLYNNVFDDMENVRDSGNLCGYYDGNSTSKSNYRFSAIINVDDGDDQMLAILFRVKDASHFYGFMWQRNFTSSPGINLKYLALNGEIYVDPNNPSYNWSNCTKIFKASPSDLPAYDPALFPYCRFPGDGNGIAYRDITAPTNYNPKGWNHHEPYKITVICSDFHYQVYISTDLSDDALGSLVCEAFDEEYMTGAPGIAVLNQKNVVWSKLTVTDVETVNVTTDWLPVTLKTHEEVKVSDTSAADMIKDIAKSYVKTKYGVDYPYIKNSAYPIPKTPDLNIRVRADGFVWAQTDTYTAGGIQSTPWNTQSTGNDISGTGKAWMQADGTWAYTLQPPVLTKEKIPSNIMDFTWNQIWQTGGDPVELSIGPTDEVIAVADLPPIVPIGTPYTLPSDMIFKQNGIKSLVELFGDNGIYTQLNIPYDTPKDQILLRIERGDANGNNMEYRVNYRWRYTLGSEVRYEVDQLYKGLNRMRLNNILQSNKKDIIDNLKVEVVAWTNFEELEAVPVLGLKIDDNRKIELEKPKVESRSMEMDNWYIRVKNGHIRKRLRLPYYEAGEKTPYLYVSNPELISYAPSTPDVISEVLLDYTIPEYKNQQFYHRPYVLVEQEYPTILNETMIQTRYAPIVLSSDVGISYLEVQALRMNSARKLRIADVDAQKGIIYLQDRIKEQDEVIVQYAYNEEWYTYTGFSMNNSTNKNSHFFHLDFNPSPGHRYTVAKQGVYESIPGDMNSVPSFTEDDRPSNELLVKQMHVYLRPTSISSIAKRFYTKNTVPDPQNVDYELNYKLDVTGNKDKTTTSIVNQEEKYALDYEIDLSTVSKTYTGAPSGMTLSEWQKQNTYTIPVDTVRNTALSVYVSPDSGTSSGVYDYGYAQADGIRTYDYSIKYLVNGVEWQTGISNYEIISMDPELSIPARGIGLDYGGGGSIKDDAHQIFNIDLVSTTVGTFHATIKLTMFDGQTCTTTLKFVFDNTTTQTYQMNQSHTNTWTKTETTGDTKQTPTVTIEQIAVKDFAGTVPFYAQSLPITVAFKINANINSVIYSFTYLSDGKTIAERSATLNDTIVVKATYTIPVITKDTTSTFDVSKSYTNDFKKREVTSDTTQVKTVSIEEIPINTITGSIPSDYQDIQLSVTSSILKNTNFGSYTFTFKSDGKNLSDRKATATDIIVVKGTYTIPVLTKTVDVLVVEPGGLINGTTRNQAIYHTDQGNWFEPDDYYYDPSMLRLGKFQVQANSQINKDMIILDTRTRGGGLDEALTNDVIQQVNQESMYNWDIGFFDGAAYQENGVIVIRLPRTLLDTFTESQIQATIAKYKAYGVLPIVEYYDPVPPDMNLIGNHDFSNEEHVTQYNAIKSSGNYVITKDTLANGNVYVLKIQDNGVYAITIPVADIKYSTYEISIKAKLDVGAASRNVANIQFTYESGAIEVIPVGMVASTDWIIYQKQIEIKPNLLRVDIFLNENNTPPSGNMYVDYVKFFPLLVLNNENMEIIEI